MFLQHIPVTEKMTYAVRLIIRVKVQVNSLVFRLIVKLNFILTSQPTDGCAQILVRQSAFFLQFRIVPTHVVAMIRQMIPAFVPILSLFITYLHLNEYFRKTGKSSDCQ